MKKYPIFYPILLALFPVLFLYSKNVSQFPLRVVVLPAILAVTGTMAIWAIAGLIFRSVRKGARAAGVIVLLAFSYSYCVALFGTWSWRAAGVSVGPKHAVAILFILALAGAIWAIHRLPDDMGKLLTVKNLFAACLVLIPVIEIAGAQLRGGGAQSIRRTPGMERPNAASNAAANRDIYYIILDGYARADVLKDIYKYDNSEFLARLKERGFIVAEHSRTNYNQTMLALSASLNMDYVGALMAGVKKERKDRHPLASAIADSVVRQFLRNRGYRFAAFTSTYDLIDITGADEYLTPKSMSEFEMGLMDRTPLTESKLSFKKHRDKVDYVFDHLSDAIREGAPVFVFAHISAPHPPFVFGPNGEERTPEGPYTIADASHLIAPDSLTARTYQKEYIDQLVYVNKRILGAMDKVLAASKPDPIIIVQSDHGPGSLMDQESADDTCLKERFSNLCAFRAPGMTAEEIPDGITPVNTFRVVLRHYFDVDLKPLPDDCYFAPWSDPYKCKLITRELMAETDARRRELMAEKGL